eukprot:gene6776-13730_t
MSKSGRRNSASTSFTSCIIIFLILVILLVFYTSLELLHANHVHDNRSMKIPTGSHLHKHSGSSLRQRSVFNLPNSIQLPSHSIPPSINEIKSNLTFYLNKLHTRLGVLAGPESQLEDIWDSFLTVSKKTTMRWDRENKFRRHIQRHDNSIFVSIASFRDPFCPMTVQSLYGMAKYPESVYVTVIQQNCFEDKCWSSANEKDNIATHKEGKDLDCYREFCESYEGKKTNVCNTGHFQVLNVNETEGLGPYMARYLASKFYRGENYYLQIDSHSEFVNDWDDKIIMMLHRAPALKPVITSYPPGPHEPWMDSIGLRMCDASFGDGYTVLLGSASVYEEKIPYRPRYTPFVAAGFLFTDASMLHEVPFDPLVPWVFMGEEIHMSARLWTHGYDLFSPRTNILNHYYSRPDKPKYWETVDRFLDRDGIMGELADFVQWRLKYVLGYPETRNKVLYASLKIPESLRFGLENYTLGSARPIEEYTSIVGIDFINKTTHENQWCYEGLWPKLAKKYKHKKKIVI